MKTNLALSKNRNLFQIISSSDLFSVHNTIKDYLPRQRYRQFMNAWVVHNFLKAPVKRQKLQKKKGFRLPSIINISPTGRCNLHCQGCYASAYNQKVEMSVEQFEYSIKSARDLGVHFIGILGGEPLLRKDLLPVMASFKNMAFRISTNGTMLDDETVTLLKKAGNIIVFFSLEGFEDETDQWRGKGMFRQVTEKMRWLKEEHILFGFSTLLHNYNKEVVISSEFLDEMTQLGNKIGLLYPYGPVGSKQYFDYVIPEDDLQLCYEKLKKLEKNYLIILILEGFISAHITNNVFFNMGCRAGNNVHITPEGFVEPCNGIQFHVHNIFQKDLEEILKSSFYLEIQKLALSCDKKCIVINNPGKVLECVRKNKAKESNQRSFLNLEKYSKHFTANVHCL